jgi:hypothetical protein
LKENLLSNGAFLWWSAALLDWLLSLVRHGLGVFSSGEAGGRRREVMEVYANGFAGHQGGYFISCESALGVMTGWRTLMGIPNGRVFSSNAKGFSLNSVHGSRMRIFCGFYAKGTRVCAYSARIKFPKCVQNNKVRMRKSKEIITTQMQEINFIIYCRNSNIPSTN